MTRPPTFTTTVDAEVEIDPSELEEAGWRYVGDEVSEETVLDVVRDWHDEVHTEPWQWCRQAPCKELN